MKRNNSIFQQVKRYLTSGLYTSAADKLKNEQNIDKAQQEIRAIITYEHLIAETQRLCLSHGTNDDDAQKLMQELDRLKKEQLAASERLNNIKLIPNRKNIIASIFKLFFHAIISLIYSIVNLLTAPLRLISALGGFIKNKFIKNHLEPDQITVTTTPAVASLESVESLPSGIGYAHDLQLPEVPDADISCNELLDSLPRPPVSRPV